MASGSANRVVVDVELRAQLDQMRSGVKELEGLFKNLNLSPNKNASMTSLFTEMKKELSEIESLTEGGKIKGKSFGELEKRLEKVSKMYSTLGKEITSLNGLSTAQKSKLFPPEVATAINNATDKLKEYKAVEKQLNAESGLKEKKKDFDTLSSTLEKAKAQVQEYKNTLEQVSSGKIELVRQSEFNNAKKALDEAKASVVEYTNKVKEAEEKLSHTRTTYKGVEPETHKKAVAELEQMNQKLAEAKAKEEELNASFERLRPGSVTDVQQALENANKTVSNLTPQVQALDNEIKKIENENPGKAFDIIKSKIQEIKGLDLNWEEITNIEELEAALSQKVGAEVERVTQKIKEISVASNGIEQPFSKMTEEVQRARQALEQTSSSMKQVEQLAQRGLYFFGLTNQVNLFKRAIRSAFETVKELDKSMTETAVVTDFSVGDMWEQLPQYTNIANEYNATLKDAYDVMTLYYQQGLETNQVFAVGTETMKMARIAGLDYGVATDRMTNALRGFNMEINNMNAEHIADVYSKLAAMSASNVKELSVAMTKTASLANSANMSFDNTAAFLAQIIETTRESAETAGTALKTVIARFSEVKKLYSEGDLIGDVDGEEVNINKVGAALRAAGVDLNEFATGAKGLDEIFIELASKWDSLDLLTQRYIATMAAGSRQQSRFLALMSDNERLTELLNGAYNATGASSEQFAKTQESLQSKLNNLKNAWDAFLMGLANSGIIKKAVDLLTKIISKINKLTDAFGKMGKVGKILSTLAISIGAFRLGSTIIQKLSIAAIGLGDKLGILGNRAQAATSIFQNFTKNLKNLVLGKINVQPMVNQIQGLTTSLKQASLIHPLSVKVEGIESIEAAEAALQAETATMVTNDTVRVTRLQNQLLGIAQDNAETASSEAKVAIYNAENASVESRNALTGEAIAATETEILAQQELLAIKKNVIASVETENLTDEQAMALQQEKAMLDKAEAANEAQLIAINKIKTQLAAGEITQEQALTRIKNIHSVANFQETLSNITLAGSFQALGASIWAVLAPLATLLVELLPLIAIGAAVTGVIIGIAAAIKAANDASASGQAALGIENTNKNIEMLEKALDDTNQSLETLKTNWEEFTDGRNNLDNLVEGSKEWQEQLNENNQKLLDIISNYTELAEYVKTNENGELYFDKTGEEKYDQIVTELEQQQKNLKYGLTVQEAKKSYYTQESELLSSMDWGKEELENRAKKEYYSNQKEYWWNNTAQSLRTKNKQGQTIYVNLSDLEMPTDQEFETFFQEQQLKNPNYFNDNEDFKEYYDYLKQHNSNLDAYNSALAANTFNQLQDNGYSSLVAKATAKTVQATTEEAFEKQYDSHSGRGKGLSKKDAEERIKSLNENYKVRSSADKSVDYEVYDETTNEIIYKVDKQGKANGDADTTDEELLNAIKAAEKGAEDLKNNSEKANKIAQLSKDYQKFLAEDYAGLDLSQINWTEDLNDIIEEDKFNEIKAKAQKEQSVQLTKFIGDLAIAFSETSQSMELNLESLSKLTEKGQQGLINLGKLGADFEAVSSASSKSLEEFANIDLNDPIEAFSQLTEMAENGDKEIQQLANTVLDSNSKILSSSSQLQSYAQSMTDDTKKAVLDLVKANKKITPKELKELAQEDEKLQKLIDNNIISVEGLCAVLPKIAEGSVSVDQLTSAFVSALGASRDVKDSLQDIEDFWSNFNPDNYTNGFDTFKSKVEELGEFLEKGQYGNAQDYIEKIFGPKKGGGAYTFDEIDAYYNKLKKYSENGGYGFFESWSGTDFGEGVSIIAKNGEVTIETAGKTYDELVKILSTKTGLAEGVIESFLTNYSAYSSDFAKIMSDAKLKDIAEKTFDGLEKLPGKDTFVLSEEELQNIADTWGVDIEQLRDAINKKIKEENGKLQTFKITKDENGNSVFTFRDQNGEEKTQDVISEYTTDGTIEYKAAFEFISANTNMTPQQIQDFILGEAQNRELRVAVLTEDGEQKVFDAMDEELLKILNDNVLHIDDSEFDTIQEKIDNYFENTTHPLKVNLSLQNPGFLGGLLNLGLGNNPDGTATKTQGSDKDGTPTQYGKIKTYSHGGATRNEVALVGEEGEELIQLKDGGAYLAGTNGPEMAELHRGDIVYSNSETEDIFKRGNLSFNRYAKGTEKKKATYDREIFAAAFSDAKASNGSGNQYGQKVDNSVGWHRGVDLHNGGGNIPSISSGTVISTFTGATEGDKGANQGWGNQVIIEDEEGNKFYYSHLRNVNVGNGSKISAGQIIGTEGSTGNSTGSHLDFMIETPSGFVNPRSFINGAELNTLQGSYSGSVRQTQSGGGKGSGSDTTSTGSFSKIIDFLAGQANSTEKNTEATEGLTKATQDLANIEREQSKLQKQLSELQEGGIYTAPWQLKNLAQQRALLKKENKVQNDILNQKKEEAKKLEEANAQWDKWLEKNEDGSYSYKEGYDDAVKNGTVDQTTKDNLSQLVSKGNEVADQQTTVDDYAYQIEEIRDQEYQVYADWIDQGVDWTNQAIEGAGQVAQSVLQMIEKVAQSMVDGFKSFLGWLTIRIDDEHDIGELNESLKNRKDLLDWEFDKYAEKDFDYTKGTNSKSQENLFENINDAAQNVLIRLQNQRRLYENSFRQLEDLGTNINSDIEASLEEMYDALYGINGVFTKINDQVQYLENRFERATKWNLTNIREMDPISKINEWFGTNIEDTIGDALKPLNIFDGTLIDTFFKKSLEQIAGLEITEYRLGNVGESLLQKIANFFYELSPKFDAEYQIVNKSELVDALNQKMQTIITNGTITSQFVQNYLDYLTEIESQMESEVDNIRNSESEILSLYDEMTEILEKGKDEYGDLEQQIYDAIVNEKESIKEELEELNDNITDADNELIDVLKNNLDQMRQMRENDKTESDLQDKEARLAYLRQDTSGANKQEILKLEKELKESQQSYTDKLIDQKISELEKQNEEAAEQRQVQIDLLQEEINNTKNIWEKVKSMMDAISGYGSWDDILKGEIKREAYQDIIDQLKKASDFDEMSSFAQDNQINEWGILIRKASLYGTMLKDEYQEAYNDLKILRDILDQDTKLPSDNAADSMWHNYVAFSNLETAVQDNTAAVKNAVSVINRIVDAKTLSFDETGSVFKKATESGATIQAMSGLEDAVKNFANDMASGLPGILTQITTGAGNLAKGMLKGMGAAADSAAGAMTGDIALGDFGEAAGMVMEGVSNFFAAGCDAISLMCDIIGDTSPGFTDMGVAAGTLIANWLDNAFEEVDDHLRENVGYILDEMYGEEVDGERLGGYYQQIGEEIAGQKEALLQYFDANGRDGEEFVKKLYAGVEERYKDINDQISKLDGNDIEGYNKQYSRFLALEKILEKIGHTETIETYMSNSINNLDKWAGEIGSLFAELSEKERQIVVDAINNAIYDVIKDEILPNGHSKAEIWENNLKFKTSDIKYYNDIYKEFIDNVNYSVDAIDEAITAINSVFYDPYENEYTSPSAQLLVRKLEQLEGKRAEQEVQNEKSIWETFIDKAQDAWGEFGNHILQIVDAGKAVIEKIAAFLEKTFGPGSKWDNWIHAIDNSHALGGAIRQTERALVGELGPELVQHANGTASIVGRHGPEITNLSPGDQVYTAEQTKKILRSGGSINFNRFAEGTVGNFIGRSSFLPGLTSIDIATPTRALAEGQTSRENNFNLNLSLEDLTVDSIERVDEVANRVWDKLNSTISNAMWPYNKL